MPQKPIRWQQMHFSDIKNQLMPQKPIWWQPTHFYVTGAPYVPQKRLWWHICGAGGRAAARVPKITNQNTKKPGPRPASRTFKIKYLS
jgi:hypothetical protein